MKTNALVKLPGHMYYNGVYDADIILIILTELPPDAGVQLSAHTLQGAVSYTHLDVYKRQHQMLRLQATPGLTCYWQIRKDDNTTFAEWVEMDLQYIQDQSFMVDLKIIFATFRIVFTGKGAC